MLGRSVVTHRQRHAQFASSFHSQSRWTLSLLGMLPGLTDAQEAIKTHGEKSQSSDMLAQFRSLKMRSWLVSRQLSSTSTSTGQAPNTGPSVQSVPNTTVQMFVKENKERCRAGARSGQKFEIFSSKALSLWSPLDTL